MPAEAATRRAKNGEITMNDVHSLGEWRQTETALGAKRVSIHDPGDAERFSRHMIAAVDGDRIRPIAMICACGNSSTIASGFLAGHGITNGHNFVEGMLGNPTDRGWIARGLPFVPCLSC